MKIRKVLKVTALVVIVLVVVLAVSIYFFLNSIVKTAVVTVLPKITGTTVTLEKADISMFSGKGTLTGLVIGNPEGFNTANAFSLRTVRVSINLRSLLSNRIIINEIYVDEPQVTYELGLSGSNIGKIQENVAKFAGPPEVEKKEGKKIQIDRFTIEHGLISLSATALQGKRVTFPLRTIELKDIGKESGGKSIGQTAKEVFDPIVNAIENAVSGAAKLIGKGIGAVGDGVGGAVDAIKGLFK